MTEANAERLAAALCRMRGAALKVGQMLSLADDKHLPAVVRWSRGIPPPSNLSWPQLCATPATCLWRQVSRALERVRAQADIMPRSQLNKVLSGQLGADWRSKFAEFEDAPFAAASIGQVPTTHLSIRTHTPTRAHTHTRKPDTNTHNDSQSAHVGHFAQQVIARCVSRVLLVTGSPSDAARRSQGGR
jgi:hypothetical protein